VVDDEREFELLMGRYHRKTPVYLSVLVSKASSAITSSVPGADKCRAGARQKLEAEPFASAEAAC
jgi:hypothetical protein